MTRTTICRTALAASLVLALGSGAAGGFSPVGEPAPTAGDRDDVAAVSFRVTDASGHPIPCRLTFHPPAGGRPDLFTNPDADPDALAVRLNSVYSIRGEGTIEVPEGTYTLMASHGLEWGIATVELELEAGGSEHVELTLEHQVDTTGWVSGDFHLHTLTHSGHGDSNMPERIISLVGEGVEFAVATDHNHNTDYQPTMDMVGANEFMTSVTGNEVSTSIGHLNAYPLEPDRPIPPHRFPAADPIFRFIREEPNRYGVVPIIQLNHPRWSGINYFGQTGLDPITGVSTSEAYSDDFDTIEIFNENECWGYYDPDETDLPVDSGSFSVLRDWFNLLNRGHTAAAVGNSDSHHVESEIAGVPRNYVRSSTDDPSEIDTAEIVGMQRKKMVFTTSGPFVTYAADGADMGSTIPLADSGRVEIAVRVQAADWVDCDVVKVVVNGDIVREIPVPDTGDALRLDTSFAVPLVARDSWITLLVEGDESLAPVVHDQGRPILPLAVMNPVWIDGDGDGVWTPPYDQAESAVASSETARQLYMTASTPAHRALLAQAVAARSPAYGMQIVRRLLLDSDRYVRLSAAHAAERLADPGLLDAIALASSRAEGDDHMMMTLFAADIACGEAMRTPDETKAALMDMITKSGRTLLSRFGPQIEPLIDGEYVRDFLYVGMFESEGDASVVERVYGPETDPDSGPFSTKTGPRDWAPIRADARGYVNLLFAEPEADARTNAIAYLRTWIVSPDEREVTIAYGTDDGSRLWINGESVIEDPTNHSADPLQHLFPVTLRPGRNEVLLKVANGGGDFGAYFRVLDDLEVTTDRE